MRALLALALVALALGPARAEPTGGVEIAWAAPEACGSAEAFHRLVEEHVGRPLDGRDRLAAQVTVERMAPAHPTGAGEPDGAEGGDGAAGGAPPDGFRASIEVASADGPAAPRTIHGATCGEVIDAAALVLAVALRRGPAPPMARTVAPASVEAAPVETPVPPRRSLRWFVRGGGAAGAGLLPGGDFGAAVGLSIGAGGWRVGVELTQWMEREARLMSSADIGARIDGWTVAGRVCRARGVGACAGLEAGELTGEGHGYPEARTGRERWVALTGGPEASLAIHERLSLFGEIDAVVAVVPPRFTLDDGTELHEPARVGVRARIGLRALIY